MHRVQEGTTLFFVPASLFLPYIVLPVLLAHLALSRECEVKLRAPTQRNRATLRAGSIHEAAVLGNAGTNEVRIWTN